jgi:hypothetical protein
MGEDNDSPRPGFDWFVSHKGQGKYFDTEWNVNGDRRETPKGYYTTVVTDYAADWVAKQPAGKPWAGWCSCLSHGANSKTRSSSSWATTACSKASMAW